MTGLSEEDPSKAHVGRLDQIAGEVKDDQVSTREALIVFVLVYG